MDTLDVQNQINAISPTAREYVSGLGKWMRFVGIVLFIFSGLSILNTLITFSTMGQMFAMMGLPGGLASVLIVVSLLFTALQIYIAYLVYQASDGFNNYTKTNSNAMLEKGFVNNQKAWLIMGILTIVSIVLMIIGGVWAASLFSSMAGGF